MFSDDQLLEDLRSRVEAGEQLKYVFFWGHQASKGAVTAACFSQWYEAPFDVDGQRYLTAEHYMMAEKAALFEDWPTREQILQAASPGAAKALGRKVAGFEDDVWCQHRFDIVCRANAAKFSQNVELGTYLAQTGEKVLVEASPVDGVWGIGLSRDDERASNPYQWKGLNLLGFALMKVRDEIQQRSVPERPGGGCAPR